MQAAMAKPPPEPPAVPPSGPHQPDNRPHVPQPPQPALPPGVLRETVLKRTVVRPAHTAPDPVDGAFVANRLTALAHDLGNLLDGSLRTVSLARRSLSRVETQPEGAQPEDETPISEVGRRLDTLQVAMAQMAELVRASMMGLDGGGQGFRLPRESLGSLADAVSHAVEVMRPIAEEKCIRLDVELAPELDGFSSGPIYTVVANGVRNAIEAIERRGTPSGGTVHVRGWLATGRTGRAVMIEILDDGVGPPARHGPNGAEDVFRLGYSTKPGGSGIGLTMSRDVVQQIGGTITLTAREPADRKDKRVGAVLRVCFPPPATLEGPGGGPLAKAG